MDFKIIQTDKKKVKFTRVDLVFYLIENHGLKREDSITFMKSKEIEFENFVIDSMGDYIDMENSEVKSLISKGVNLGFLTN